MVTHDPQISARAERRIVLRDGLIIEDSLELEPAMTARAER
jgi:ABC-type lipoprotein export system ATPase subunit